MKTGGGGPVGPQLSETEKRLIGVMGWSSIRGDGTLELGSPTSIVSQNLPFVSLHLGYCHE